MSVSYISDSNSIAEPIYQKLINSGLSSKQIHFWNHCRISSNIQKSKLPATQGYFPVPSQTLIKMYGRNYKSQIIDPLIERELIYSSKSYSIEEKKCKSYCINEEFVLDNSSLELLLQPNVKWVNPYKERRVTPKQTYSNKSGHKYPTIILEALKSISPVKYNIELLLNHLTELKEQNVSRYLTDYYCLGSLIKRQITYNIDSLDLYYKPMYDVGFAGRIYEFEGGTQSMSRYSRKLLVDTNINALNYDLKSSQVYALLEFFEEAQLDTSWLWDYIKSTKQEYASKIGISVDCWKRCLIAVIMGAKLQKGNDNSIYNYLLEEADNQQELCATYLSKLKRVLKPLTTEIDKWHNFLIHVKAKKEQLFLPTGIYISNNTGAPFCLSEYLDENYDYIKVGELKRRLAAFYLQGYEASFIFYLQALSRKYGYLIYGNYHDGIISEGVVPQEAIEEAKYKAGVKYAQLEIKPIV